jgi:hypothetical protein
MCLALPVASRAFDETAGKERIGVRAGGVATNDGFKDAYGGGWDLTLFFTERSHTIFFSMSVSAPSTWATSSSSELDDKLLNQSGIRHPCAFSSLRWDRWWARGSPGRIPCTWRGRGHLFGQHDDRQRADARRFSDQNFGFNGEFGLARRISTNWSIEAEAAAHYMLIKKDISDVYFAFTDGADAPLIFDATLGITVDLRYYPILV